MSSKGRGGEHSQWCRLSPSGRAWAPVAEATGSPRACSPGLAGMEAEAPSLTPRALAMGSGSEPLMSYCGIMNENQRRTFMEVSSVNVDTDPYRDYTW